MEHSSLAKRAALPPFNCSRVFVKQPDTPGGGEDGREG